MPNTIRALALKSIALLGFSLLGFTPLGQAQSIIVPQSAATSAGTGGYSTILHLQERSYQVVIGTEELTGISLGESIVGITWRRPSWISYSDWPEAGTSRTFASFDVSLSQSLNPPGSLSSDYLDNIGPDVVMVRQGPLTLQNPDFPGGAISPAINPFGEVIAFDVPYVYAGGDLLITIRHTGNGGSNGFVDAVGSPFTQAIGVSSYTQETDWYSQGMVATELSIGGSSAPEFRRGDINTDGALDVADAVFGLNLLFVPGTPLPGCPDARDVNDDGAPDIADVVYLLASLFIPGAPTPPDPADRCGQDPTPDTLDCPDYAACP